jgi:hypothetical protein
MENEKIINGASLLETYLGFNRLKCKSKYGKAAPDGHIFMPMLLMDAMNMIYEEYVAPLPLKHREKQIRTRWHEAYKHFIKQEFMAFNDDQKCELCDMMDDFESYIHNEVEMFRVASMGRFMQYSTEVRLTLSGILACSILAQSAEYIWNTLRGRKYENMYIKSVVQWSHELLDEYGDNRLDRTQKKIDLNEFENIRSAVNKLCTAVGDYTKRIIV